MGPDWFTVVAQVINFLILVALLKRFLYGPIINAMERREREIADRLDDAANKALEAEREGDRYRQMAREVADTRDKMLSDARGEAEALRRDLKQKAREETDRIRTQWNESFRLQKEAFRQEIRFHACTQVSAVVRRALADMADMELESHMIEVFIRRIRDMEPAIQKEIADSIPGAGGRITVRSAFDINSEGKRKIVEAIGEHIVKNVRNELGLPLRMDMDISFETSASLICGLEIVADGRKVTWDLEGYLDELEQSLARVFENGAAGSVSK